MDEKVIALYRQGNYAEAIKVAEKASKIAIKEFGPDHIYTQTAQNNLAFLCKVQNKAQYHNTSSDLNKFHEKSGKIKGPALTKAVLAIIFFLAVISSGGLIVGMAQKTEPTEVFAAQAEMLPYYRVEADFYPENCVVRGEEEVVFDHQNPDQEVVFDLYLNNYNNPDLESFEMRKYARDRGAQSGYIDIVNVSYQGRSIPFQEEDQLLRVSLDNDLFSPGEQALKIKFQIKIPQGADRVGGNEKGFWLGNWLPTLSVDGKAHQPTEIGDPFVNFSSTYDVIFSVPKDYQLVLSNVNDVQDIGERKVYHGRLEKIRDLPVFLNKGYAAVMAKQGDTEIFYYYLNPESRDQVLSAACKAMAFYEEYVGDYPWKQLNIVENDMYLSGMEYSTLLLLSSRAIRDNCVRTVFHEVGHQWFYNIIGNDQYKSPFIDEGCVEFLTSYALDDREYNYESDFYGLNRDLGQFSTWREYRKVHYYNGRKWFESLYSRLGKKNFDNFLQDYYDHFKYSLVSRDELASFIADRSNDQSIHRLLGYIRE